MRERWTETRRPLERLLTAGLAILALLALAMPWWQTDAAPAGEPEPAAAAEETPEPDAGATGEGDEEEPADSEGQEPVKPWWEEDPQNWTLDQTRTFQKFVYQSGGRSPFAFSRSEEKPKRPSITDIITTIYPDRPSGPKETDQESERLQKLYEYVMQMEIYLLAKDYAAALEVCAESRGVVESEWGPTSLDGESYRMYQKILSYEKTARRLQQALQTKEEFESLPIDIRGIRWTPHGSVAIINEQIYESGHAIQDLRSTSPVQVETIHADSIVFLYKGQRFRKTMRPEEQEQNP